MSAKKIKRIFEECILPAHKGVVAEAKCYFPVDVSIDADSYYENPKHSDQVMFSFISTDSAQSITHTLKEIFDKSGSPEFDELAKQIGELAFEIKQTEKGQSTDLSPFVYVMY